MTSTIIEQAKSLYNTLRLLHECFISREGLKDLALMLPQLNHRPQIKTYTAYRYIVLTNQIESSYPYFRQEDHQLDWDKLKQPYQSWAKTLAGAKFYFANLKDTSHKYKILVKAQVKAFDIQEFTLEVQSEARKLLRLQENLLRQEDPRLLMELTEMLRVVTENLHKFSGEEEIVPVEEVADFEFLEGEET